MEIAKTKTISSKAKISSIDWDPPHCLFIFGNDESADNDLKEKFEIIDED